jgi:hypothetical protein
MAFIANLFRKIGFGGSTIPNARSANVSGAVGSVYSLSRLLSTSSTFALLSGSHSSLTVNSTTGVISATAALPSGASSQALVRETDGLFAVEYPVTLSVESGATLPPAPTNASIVLPADVWAFGASSMQGSQQITSTVGGTEDSLTNVVRAIEGLAEGSLSYTTTSGSQTSRPIDYNLTGANAARKVRNRGVGGQTSGSAGTIAATMQAQAGNFATSDFVILHQGDNGLTVPSPSVPETLAGGYAALRGYAGSRPFVMIGNTQGGRGSTGSLAGEPPGSAWGYVKATSLRIQSDLFPGRFFSFAETLLDRSTPADANDSTDLSQAMAPRSYMMNDGSHQIAKGYNLQSDVVLTPLIDAWAGGTPFALKQIVESTAPASPAAGDVIGTVFVYGSGGIFALDASNTQAAYAVSSAGQITRTSSALPVRDVTWLPVKTSKAGRADKVQPRIGVCERAAPGVSKMVEFDGASVIGMPDSKFTNSAKMTLLFRVRATDQSVIQFVMAGLNQCQIRLLTGGTLDVNWRNAAGTVIVSKTTTALFTTASADRWVALCIDLTDPAAEVTKLVTWAVPATAVTDSALHANLSADTTTAQVVRLDTPMAFGHSTVSAAAGSTFSKLRLGDITIWRDFIDFGTQENREMVSDAAGLPLSNFVSSGGAVSNKTPDFYLGGNAGDFRQGRIRGSLAPATPGAVGQYIAHNARQRPDGELGYLATVP